MGCHVHTCTAALYVCLAGLCITFSTFPNFNHLSGIYHVAVGNNETFGSRFIDFMMGKHSQNCVSVTDLLLTLNFTHVLVLSA